MKYCEVHTLLNAMKIIVWMRNIIGRLLLFLSSSDNDFVRRFAMFSDSILLVRKNPTPIDKASCGTKVELATFATVSISDSPVEGLSVDDPAEEER